MAVMVMAATEMPTDEVTVMVAAEMVAETMVGGGRR
jgi:hypothetical protein